MKIIEDTPQRLIVTCRRKIFADIIFLFFLGMGALVTNAMARENMLDGVNVLALFVGLLFVGIGVWGLLTNASDHVTLDATTRTLTIERRRLMARRNRDIPFSDLKDISVHEDDDMHTVAFILKDSEEILLETAFSGNKQAAPLARHIREWLHGHNEPQATIPFDAT